MQRHVGAALQGVTDCAEACCCAFTSETILPSREEKELLSAGVAAGKSGAPPPRVVPGKRSICDSRSGE